MNSKPPSSLFGSSCYVQSIGKVGVKNSTPVKIEPDKVSVLSKCGRFSSSWVCEDDEDHKVAKELDCNREWCEKCREPAHGRRIARWLPKARKIAGMGYMVVSPPHDDRQPKTKAEFSRIGRLITEALQRRGIKRGFRRVHPFGEDRGGDYQPYHPHFNFLFEARYVSKEKLASIKKVVREIFGSKKIDVHYQYSRSTGKIFHWIKYVLRPTFLKQSWDYELAEELYNFRNCVSWGKWNDGDKWDIPEEAKRWEFLVKIEQGICPVCGGRLVWRGVCHTEDLVEKGYEQVYLKIRMCGASPRMVQTFDLLKTWAGGFGGLNLAGRKALAKFFEVLNSSFLPHRVENNEDAPCGGDLGGKAPSCFGVGLIRQAPLF